jgi:hypothetical protein
VADNLGFAWPFFTMGLQSGIGGGLPADTDVSGTVTLDEWFAYADSFTGIFQNGVVLDTGGLGGLEIVDTTVAPPAGMDIVTIDTGTGAVTPVWTNVAVRNIPALAVDVGGMGYAINGDTNRLLTIDTGAGVFTDFGPIFTIGTGPSGTDEIVTDPFVALDFVNGQLYGATRHMVYEIEPFGFVGPEATPVARGLGTSHLSALGYDPTDPGGIWAIDSPAGPDSLVRVDFGYTVTDASQTPTPIFFDANGIARPNDVDAEGFPVQIVTAPDDWDLYDIGFLPEGTPITVTLLTRTIGSELIGQVAIFNSSGETIVSTAEQSLSGDLDSYVDLPLAEAYAPADDNYTVAVWGMVPGFFGPEYVNPFGPGAPYDLKVEVGAPVLPVPVPPMQTVYLNFTGGNAPFLADEFGPGTSTYQGAFEASDFGFFVQTDTQTMIDQIVAKTQAMYAAYPNIQFTTQRPFTGNYSEVIIGGDVAPEIDLYGIAEAVDPLNSNPSDMAVIFGGEHGDTWHNEFGFTMDEVTSAVANTTAHEVGHLLGLEHQVERDAPPYLIMAYEDTYAAVLPQEFGRGPLEAFLIGYQNDEVLLRVIA